MIATQALPMRPIKRTCKQSSRRQKRLAIMSASSHSLPIQRMAIYNKSYAEQEVYFNLHRALCVANSVPYLDIYKAFQTYEAANTLGYYYDTFVHQSAAGNMFIGGLEAALLFENTTGGRGTNTLLVQSFDTNTNYKIAGANFVSHPTPGTVIIGGTTAHTSATWSAYNKYAGR